MEESPRSRIDASAPAHPERASEPHERDRDAPISLERVVHPERPGSKPLSATLERLEAHTPDETRYELEGEIARGGMGIIQRVWDGDLRRSIARKILGRSPSETDSRRSDPRTVGRFLEEAQVTAQLEHPGIVPVHELGVDRKGTLYFTMRLVRGEDLHRIFEHARAGTSGWNQTRALNVLLKVCEAMAFAHGKGVVHRDLKPSNVMVGGFGETYVMDWGLARVLGEHEGRDLRLQSPPASDEVRTDRDSLDRGSDSPLFTRDGDVVGTPAYMSPEQARGELALIGPATDVYALGAMLYHLLTGRVPYSEPEKKLQPRSVLGRVLDGPPEPIETLVPAAAPELVAICEKAMAREIDSRYPTMLELAEDLRSYLELRVVRAHRTGALIELTKWVRRNRLSAASLGMVVVALTGGGVAVAWQQLQRRLVEERRSLERAAESLLASEEELWPIDPARAPAMEDWIAEAREAASWLSALHDELRAFERLHGDALRETDPSTPDSAPRAAELAFLESRRKTYASCADLLQTGAESELSPEAIENELLFPVENLAVLQLELPALEQRIADWRAALSSSRTWRYADPDLERAHAPLARLIARLERLSRGVLTTVEARLGRALELERSLTEHAEDWRRARAAIADASRAPPYAGLELEPQLGLVPLGQDPRSGLWEFWHVLSGARPRRDETGRLVVEPDTGIVLVLVPGGRFVMGSQDADPEGPNYFGAGLLRKDDWMAEIEVDPFFLSKYELTQGQWLGLTGERPSEHFAGSSYLGMPRLTRTHPVESVTWKEVDLVLGRYGLLLPTEAQWERAARAGRQSKYSTGRTFEELVARANFLDASAGGVGWQGAHPTLDDGFALHSPVDAGAPDAWGFHALFGNVEEWCRDWYATSCERDQFLPGTGEHVPRSAAHRACRGGGFRTPIEALWVSSRYGRNPSSTDMDIGVRPSRAVDP